MVNIAIRSLKGVDAVLLLLTVHILKAGRIYFDLLKNIKTPVILLLNKSDLMTKSEINFL